MTEFACAPQLSPTSMYLTVPSGKNVSIVCRVASDPASEVNWFFNGRRIAEDFVLHSDVPVAAATDRNNDREAVS